MGLFSKPKVPGIDTGALNRINEQNRLRQQQIVTGLSSGLQPINQKFQQDRSTLSARIPTETEAGLQQYGQELQGVNALEANTRNAANIAQREQSFRDVPELQRTIRESLGGSGTIGNAAALSAVSRPIIDANRSSRDFTNQNEIERLNNVANREQSRVGTNFATREASRAERFGLDKDTVDYLNSIGRSDLISEADKMLGIDEQYGSNQLGIEQARQQNEIAKASADAARRGGIISSLGSLTGTAVGFGLGGPLGAGIGSQLGGIAGNLAGGGTGGGTFDPTLLYAMSQRNANPRKTAVVNSLGGQIPVRPY